MNFDFFTMPRKKQIDILSVILVFSILSALFMPANVALVLAFPLFIFIASKNTSILITMIALFVISFGGLYFFAFVYLIHIFPTYVVLLATTLIILLIPKRYSIYTKITIFFIVSTILGLNIQLLTIASDISNQRPIVQEKIDNVLYLKDNDIIQITGNTLQLPENYNKYDYITFGANEGVGGFWEYPKIEKRNIGDYLKNINIAYTQKNNSPYIINIDYTENNNIYNAVIQIKSNGKILSYIKVSDRLPFSTQINNSILDDLSLRLEYLLKHNIWNMFIMNQLNNSKQNLINSFLEKSIKYKPNNNDWAKHTYFIKSDIVKTIEIQDCTLENNDNYKYYEFNMWKDEFGDKSAKITAHNIFSFDSNYTTYSTKILSQYSDKIQAHNQILWNDYNFSYATNNNIYAFYTYRLTKYIRILKFTKTGKFVKELYVELPQDLILDGRDWHPISHVSVMNNRMQFRLYNIYETKNAKNKCKYYILETEL